MSRNRPIVRASQSVLFYIKALRQGLLILLVMTPCYVLSQDKFALTVEQFDEIKGAKLSAAMAWHGSSPWIQAVTAGAREEFERLGIKVVAVTEAHYDPAKQVSDLETLKILHPDILLSLSVDGLSTKPSYLQMVGAGTRLVLLSNPISGFRHGVDFAGIVEDDVESMGNAAAQLMVDAISGKGRVGIIYHEADYPITNRRDAAFRQALRRHAGIKIVSEKGFTKKSHTAQLTAAMLIQNPKLDGIYVSWDAAAEGVIEALRMSGHKEVKVITHDLGVNNLIDMALGGNMYGTVSDRPNEMGKLMARIGAGAAIGLKTPLTTQVDFNLVTRVNIADSWRLAFATELPAILQQAVQQGSQGGVPSL
ncbi:substrate-binding domain-containing protein [Pseudoalteromonas sp. SMS1]|uniref:substrate-binding domain-containing protein n=1 Tax=Pseudoalteromonas sp. SMS1 TaxID=2908894 RepID=UPI001F2BEEF9|nr:substrate-binding domain-containing protein [Pseudoalteromonas sp. SMS1]MCF2856585.1 substrate-binding domain-containing protein [Pseudoalteromonas sp. SMS1]